jgi:L-asparaginase II
MNPVPVIAEVVRSGFVESRHRGSVVVLGRTGETEVAFGDVLSPVSPRSANKPMQAVGILSCRIDLPADLLALATASHAGDAVHLDGVRKILAAAGLDESVLRNPPTLPLDERVAEEHVRSGGRPAAVVQNCSGQHAAMLAACTTNGWPTETYLAADHPLQVTVARTVSELAGEPIAATLVDGCGLPLFTYSLTGLARAYRTLVTAAPGMLPRRVADAMRAHPDMVAGDGMLVTNLMQAVPGLLAKSGAEGVMALALPDGRAAAVKIEDGSSRSIPPIAGALLDRLGTGGPAVATLTRAPVFGVADEVGGIRPTSAFLQALDDLLPPQAKAVR